MIGVHESEYLYGQNVTLLCVGIGCDPCTFSWGTPDSSSSLERAVIANGSFTTTLTFVALEDDTGTYSCQVGVNMAETTVTVGNVI